MDQTPNIGLPYIMPSQAQKHVTHNESLGRLDAVVQLSVIDRDLATPPASPADGDRYVVAAAPTGAWTGQQDNVAAWQDGAWTFLSPRPGWMAWVADEAALVYWSGTAWDTAASAISELQNLALLGVGTAADAANPFSAKLNKALWTAKTAGEGGDGDLRYTLNKEADGDVLSLLMQTGFSGRAEFGLIGDDNVTLKVSPDGSSWIEAMHVNKTTGEASFSGGLAHRASGFPASLYMPSPGNGDIWQLSTSRTATPRTATINSITGDEIELTTTDAGKFYNANVETRARFRIWNTSKSPAQPAWINDYVSTTRFKVSNSADIAGWVSGETIRLGDPNPTGANTLNMVAVDIGDYMDQFAGGAFPQKGVHLMVYVSSSNGSSGLELSGTGAPGTVCGGNALSNGTRNQISMPVPTPVASPISNSNLLFVRETLAGGATDLTLAFARILGFYV